MSVTYLGVRQSGKIVRAPIFGGINRSPDRVDLIYSNACD
jgi:hypothetical protein